MSSYRAPRLLRGYPRQDPSTRGSNPAEAWMTWESGSAEPQHVDVSTSHARARLDGNSRARSISPRWRSTESARWAS